MWSRLSLYIGCTRAREKYQSNEKLLKDSSKSEKNSVCQLSKTVLPKGFNIQKAIANFLNQNMRAFNNKVNKMFTQLNYKLTKSRTMSIFGANIYNHSDDEKNLRRDKQASNCVSNEKLTLIVYKWGLKTNYLWMSHLSEYFTNNIWMVCYIIHWIHL